MTEKEHHDEFCRRVDLVPEPKWAGRKDWGLVGCALECLFTATENIDAGLWGGSLLPRAMEALNRLVDKYADD